MFRVDPPLIGSMFPTKRPHAEVIEELRQEQLYALAAMYWIVSRGRSAHIGLGADGLWHIRRRARQIRRDFGQGVTIAADRSDSEPPPWKRWARPWWWGI